MSGVTVAATMWKGAVLPLARAAGRLTVDSEQVVWRPVLRTPFFDSVTIRVADISSAHVGGVPLVGPDLRIETRGETFRFTVLRRGRLRECLSAAGIAIT